MPDQIRLFTVLAFFDCQEARVPVARENRLAALQNHRRMRRSAVALVAGNVEADRIVDVILNHIFLPGADGLPVDLSHTLRATSSGGPEDRRHSPVK